MSIARQFRRHRPCIVGRGGRVEWALEPADTAAVPRLRQQIMQSLRRHAAPDADLTASELVVAELLSNALAHTPGKAWVSLRWDGIHPLLSVADLGPGFPTDRPGLISTDRSLVPRLPEDPLAEGGRGLYLVAHLALDVAVATRATGGSVVSVTLNLRRRGSRDEGEGRARRIPLIGSFGTIRTSSVA
jgi:anti-sigma regulatory factor (Ser/Thr protein kinase)